MKVTWQKPIVCLKVDQYNRDRSNPEFWAKDLEVDLYARLTCTLEFTVSKLDPERQYLLGSNLRDK